MFKMRLADIQPSQLYISSEKLSRIMKGGDSEPATSLEPVPVKNLDGRVIFTDGHTRALAAHLAGYSEISVYWDLDELDWEEYRICVDWCKEEGISTIADLKDRVIQPEDYERLWLKRCQEMQRKLQENRNGKSSPVRN